MVAEAQGVADLIAARDIADYGSTDASVEEVQNYWEAPRFDLAQDARIIVAPDGLIVGYEEVYPRSDERLEFDGYVHPRETGRGFGTLLLRWAEERARQRVGEMQTSRAGHPARQHRRRRSECQRHVQLLKASHWCGSSGGWRSR